jgi:hypothetical protein
MQQVDVTNLQQVFSKPAAKLQQTVSSLFFVSLSILKYRYALVGYVLLAIGDAVAVGGEITP